MNKNSSSKKNSIEQLYKILDNGSKKEPLLYEKDVLKSLSLRLKSSDKEEVLKSKTIKELTEENSESLKPKVNIHIREKKRIEIIEYKKEKQKEKPYEKELLEIEKIDVTEPKFTEVEPESITKTKIKILSKKEKLPEKELIEWEEVNIKSTEPEEIKDEISEKVTTEPVEFIEKIDNEIIEEIKKEKMPKTSSILGKIRKGKNKKEEFVEDVNIPTEEEIPAEKEPITEEFDLDFNKKIETFKDYKSINEETAIILYNYGYKTTESLKNITIEDLRNIKGIKNRTAKKIKKEIDKKTKEEEPIIFEGVEEELKEDEELTTFKELEKEEEEWKQIEEKELKEELPTKTEESVEEHNKIIETFKEYKSINEETAIILYNYGYKTTESLKNITIEDLRNIKGIKNRTANKIKKEIDRKGKEEEKEKLIFINEAVEEELKEDEELTTSKELEKEEEEWKQIEEKELKEELPTKTEESVEEHNKIIETFKEYKNINQKTALLLYNNGYKTTESLKNITIEDLKNIKGIKRRTAKKIKKEIDRKTKEEEPIIFQGVEEDKRPEREQTVAKYKDEKIEELESEKKHEEEEVFRGITSIDERISKLLIECDIDSIDTLRKMTIKDLTRIRGIKRRTAKKIKKEITMLPEETIEHHKKELTKPKEKIEKDDKKKASKKEIKGFTYKGYTLFEKEIKTKSGKKYFIKIFSKAKPKGAKPIDLPKDFMAIINKKTGIPYLKKKK